MNSFLQLVNNPFKFRLYLFFRLPAAYFSGIKIYACTPERCVTSVPMKWLTQNPFRSTYFASLAMAAEMSTGVLALNNIYKKKPPVSMLITSMDAQYLKKAKGITYFTCEEGIAIRDAVKDAASKVEGTVLTVTSTGRNSGGELVARFNFTWSFKAKKL